MLPRQNLILIAFSFILTSNKYSNPYAMITWFVYDFQYHFGQGEWLLFQRSTSDFVLNVFVLIDKDLFPGERICCEKSQFFPDSVVCISDLENRVDTFCFWNWYPLKKIGYACKCICSLQNLTVCIYALCFSLRLLLCIALARLKYLSRLLANPLTWLCNNLNPCFNNNK